MASMVASNNAAGPSHSSAGSSNHSRHEQPSAAAGPSSRPHAEQPRHRLEPTKTNNDAKMIGQWRIGRTIGKGSSGRVKIAKHSITNKYAAIKIVPKGLILSSRMSVSEAGARAEKVLQGIEREIVIMKLIDHPNVLSLFDVWETSTELYLIMEYVPGGELFDYLVKRGRLPISEALHYFQQIIHAVDYCHRFNICHRDLKPENLLLDKDKNIKVADFGMAAWEAGERMLETSCGSPHYASPEIVAGKAYHGSSSDIWSCGIILFALLTGRLPFDDDNIRSLLQKVKVGTFVMPDEIKNPARDLLFRMLEKDPERRITMPEILKHPFFVSRPIRPIPGRELVSPPSLDEVERPVNSPAEIDPDIMGNLKTLWSGASDDEIVAALMSKDKTWEKAIYHLLVKYRNKHLENYNMDDEEEEAAKRRAARKAAAAAAAAAQAQSPPKRKGAPVVTARPQLTPLKERTANQDILPARPAAPTPKKAAALAPPESPRVGGPRPRPISGSPNPTPAIVLQEATPTKENVPSSRPASVAIVSPPRVESPLNAPHVADERLQHFFNEVANQLNSMNVRSSVASNSSTSSAILGSDYQAYLAFVAGGSASAPKPIIEEEDTTQFADADDDHTDAASVHSYSPSIVAVQASPLVGLGIGGPARNLAPSPQPNQNRWSYQSAVSPSPQPLQPQLQAPLRSPSPSQWARPALPKPPAPASAPMPAALAASRAAPARPPMAHRPTVQIAAATPLPRDESWTVIDDAKSVASDPMASWSSKQSGFSAARNKGQDAFGMLKRKKVPEPIQPVALSSTSAQQTPSPKRSWFNNLFSFKPAACTLSSPLNISETREKARKALTAMNVRVAVVELEGVRALKCRLDEVKDAAGNSTTKGVRFRVEFARGAPIPGSVAYATSVSLTQEKGAQSAFQDIFALLQRDLEGSPRVGARPASRQAPAASPRLGSGGNSPNMGGPARFTISAPTTPILTNSPRFEKSPQVPASLQIPSTARF